MPLKIDDNKYLIYDSFEDSITDNFITKEQVFLFLKDFYLNMFSETYLNNFIGMLDKTGFDEVIRQNTFDSEKKKEIKDKIKLMK